MTKRLDWGSIWVDWQRAGPDSLSAGRAGHMIIGGDGELQSDVAFQIPAQPPGAILDASLSLAVDECWVRSSGGEAHRVTESETIPFPHARFLITRTDDDWVLFDLPWRTDLTLRMHATGLVVTANLADRTRGGFSVWGAGKLTEPLTDKTLVVRRSALDSLSAWPQICALPADAPSALCITDHPDFDTTPLVCGFAEEFSRVGLRITKGVFPGSTPIQPRSSYGPGLDDSAYRNAIDSFANGGSEIALHAFGPGLEPPTIAECEERVALMRSAYRATTWIDHGAGGYLQSRRDCVGTERLTSWLIERGIDSFWSYSDARDNPLVGPKRRWISHAMRSPKHIAYLALHRSRDVFGINAEIALRKHRNWDGLLRAQSLAGAHRPSHRNPLWLYGADGGRVPADRGEAWFFDTVALNHLGLQLQPAYLAELAKTTPLLFVHCYLANRSTHAFGSPLDHGGKITGEFRNGLAGISAMHERGDLVTLPFNELRAYLQLTWKTRMVRRLEGWSIIVESKTGTPWIRIGKTVVDPSRVERAIDSPARESLSSDGIIAEVRRSANDTKLTNDRGQP